MELDRLDILKEFRMLISDQSLDILKTKANDLEPYFLADIIEMLEPAKQSLVFRLLSKNHALEVFEYLEVDFQQSLIQAFSDEEALKYFKNLEPDDRAALMDELPAKVAKVLLQSLSQKEKDLTVLVMGYKTGSAGNLMTPKYLSFRKGKTVEQALLEIRKKANNIEMIYHMYVTNQTRQIEGTLDLKALLTSSPETLLEKIMEDPIYAFVDDNALDVSKLMQDSDVVAIPIVDTDQRLVGVFTVDDAMDVLSNDAIETALTASGLVEFSSKETDRSKVLISGKTIDILKVRIPFLLITLFGTLFAGTVIAFFEENLARVTALAFFIPVVMAMGGNVGSQSSTIFTRALALGQIDLKRFLKQWRKEVFTGLMMGFILGFLAFVVVFLWQDSLALSITIGTALFTSITLATALGYMIPFILLKLGIDQAAGAIPFITTIQDILGLLIYFLLALLLI